MLMGPLQRRHSCRNRTNINISPSKFLTTPRTPGLILLVLLALLAPTALADEFKNDFSLYPKAAQACLDAAAAGSGCAATTNQEMNKCLCGGTAFALSTASCVGTQSPGDLQAVYTIMSTSCSDSKVNMAVTKDQFLATASAAPPAATTTFPPVTFTTTFTTMISNTPTTVTTVITTVAAAAQTTGPASPTPTPTPATSDNGMSNMAKTGIIAGAAVAGVAIMALLIVFILRHRRKRAAAEEAHPMLPVGRIDGAGGGGGGGAVGGPFKDQLSPSSHTATPSTAHGWKTDEAKWGQHQITPSPSPLSFHSQHQQPGWGYDPTSGGYGQQAPPYTTQQVFEAPGLEPQKPVEMPATPAPVPDWVRQHQQPQHFMHTPHQPHAAGQPLFPDNAQRRPQNRPPGSPSVHYIPHGS
ncbi:hypothetical protein RB594_008101 [Gaeumannomyces avenae]